MIEIEKEPEEYSLRGLGELETCCFCEVPTPYWSVKKNVPVCRCCARLRCESEVPDPEHWIVFSQMKLEECSMH